MYTSVYTRFFLSNPYIEVIVTLQVWKKAPIFDFSAPPIIPGDMEKRLLVGLSTVAGPVPEDDDVESSVSMVVYLKICWCWI